MSNSISKGEKKPENIPVATAVFSLEAEDLELIPEEFHGCKYSFTRYLSNRAMHHLIGAPAVPTYRDVQTNLVRMAAHIDAQRGDQVASGELEILVAGWRDTTYLAATVAKPIENWLTKHLTSVEEDNQKEETRYTALLNRLGTASRRDEALAALERRIPVFVLFSNYFRVRPVIHLGHLAARVAGNVMDDDQYDYGNLCLLQLLGFTPQELSDLGKAAEPSAKSEDAMTEYRDQLDRRSYQLNAASVSLTREIQRVWNPNQDRGEASKLRMLADGQYLKVVVEDDLGVDIELDQRSEGFQWIVSFFVVFFAEAVGKHKNAILLLDEPGLSLHALKQREFRETVSRLAENNQTIYTTHSPFLVGPDELDRVRVVEMSNREIGTKVHTVITSSDPASLLPLQEALGYDLAQSLFTQKRNLVLEGLTDLFYFEALTELLADGDHEVLNESISLVPANSATKVVYYATILHAQKLKVAALLDSDSSGEKAANQHELVHTLGNNRILRTKDFVEGEIANSEIEDLLRETLIKVAKEELGWDIEALAAAAPKAPIVSLFNKNVKDFSKYRLAKAFVRWSRSHNAADLSPAEVRSGNALVAAVNKILK